MLAQAIGGAVAVVVGVIMTSFLNRIEYYDEEDDYDYFPTYPRDRYGRWTVSVEDSIVAMTQCNFTSCAAESLTQSSFGTSSVFGGAFAIYHLPRVSQFFQGLLKPLEETPAVIGFSLTALILKSCFSQCSARSSAASVFPGKANGGGGAIYANSVALTNFSVIDSTFISNRVTVTSGATGLSSFSSGGAVAVEAGVSNSSLVALSCCSFVDCTAQGANILSMEVRGGAVHVSRAANISVAQTNFTNCSVIGAVKGAGGISGGASMSVNVTGYMSVTDCIFDATGGQDASSSSAGLLLFARNASSAQTYVTGCTFISSTVVLNVRCVDNDGEHTVGICVGLRLMLENSRVVQVYSQFLDDSNAIGSTLMIFQMPEFVLFKGSIMQCAIPQFAAFKKQSFTSSLSATAYLCKPCEPFFVSSTANAVLLENLSNASNVDRCYHVSDSPGTLNCPFAVAACTTFVSVASGFWTTISELERLDTVRRCPRGYCGCTNSTNGCPLPAPISINRSRDPLCNGNRTGKLCGGCLDGFTQSMDDKTCISNDDCSNSLWWVWTLSILGFAAYGLYVVISCRKLADGAIACLFFYFQMSSFAADAEESDSSFANSILEISQVRSAAATYRSACYAPSTGAYNATALKLIGPLSVLLFAVAWTCVIQKLRPKLQQRNIDIAVSYSGSIAVTLLFAFSNVANVVFTLVECTGYSDSADVVFIDGTVPCRDATWYGLIVVAALLFFVPVAFAAALCMKKLPPSARHAVCGTFTAPVFYWGAVTLTFRLLVSATQFLRVDFPNVLAFVRMLLTVCVFFLLVNLRPYVHERTFWVDVACYVCLIAQFGLQGFGADRDYIAAAVTSKQGNFFSNIAALSTLIRRAFLLRVCPR
jgi:hypothetical protein